MTRKHVAVAILHRQDQFLMQLRENIPTIVYPGYWGFFGGHIEPGELPEVAIKRELLEEIGYTPPRLQKFAQYESETVVRHVFYGALMTPVETLELHEGWDLGLFSLADIERGDRYSERAQQVRPLGSVHRQILLDFVEQAPHLQPASL